MIHIEWTNPAFVQLEALPPSLAFEIIARVDLLITFPEMGAPLASLQPALAECRQLIINRAYRVVYECDQSAKTIWILAVQHCRQRLPTARELKRRKRSSAGHEE